MHKLQRLAKRLAGCLSLSRNHARQLAQEMACGGSKEQPQITVESLHVNSTIQSRFATTVVECRVTNRGDSAAEAQFSVTLPHAAFITKFSMVIDGETIHGVVKNKLEAQQTYDVAKRAGKAAGHVAKRPRETNTFQVSVNVTAFSDVCFKLTYQEMLERVHGFYKHVIDVQPGQVVADLQVRVRLEESREISSLHVPSFGEGVGERLNRDLLGLPRAANVQIKQFHDDGLCSAEVVNGYFVHFFAPSGLPVAQKHVIFVVDISGSMIGRKLDQTKEALVLIIGDLHEKDYFNIVAFNVCAKVWSDASRLADSSNRESALQFIDGLRASYCTLHSGQLLVACSSEQMVSGTDIERALRAALRLFDKSVVPRLHHPMLILLTDGEPTMGVSDSNDICANVAENNLTCRASIHSLGFGRAADFALLMRLSDANRGLARKLYEDSDAALQLHGFYQQISNPLLTDIKFRYLDNFADPESIVRDGNGIFYEGSETVVLGMLTLNLSELDDWVCVDIESTGCDGPRSFKASSKMPSGSDHLPPSDTIGGIVERMWAYKTVKKLLDKAKYIESDSDTGKRTRDEAMRLCLKYQFVTELTSMVLVQPEKVQYCLLSTDGDDLAIARMDRSPFTVANYFPTCLRHVSQFNANEDVLLGTIDLPKPATSDGPPIGVGDDSPRKVVKVDNQASNSKDSDSDSDDFGSDECHPSFHRCQPAGAEPFLENWPSPPMFDKPDSTSLPPNLYHLMRNRPLSNPETGTVEEPSAFIDATNPVLINALRLCEPPLWAPLPPGALLPIEQPEETITEIYDAPPPDHTTNMGGLGLNIFLAGDYALYGMGAALCKQLEAWHVSDGTLPWVDGYRTLLPLSERRRLFELRLIVGSVTGAEHLIILASQTDFSALALARDLAAFGDYKRTKYRVCRIFDWENQRRTNSNGHVLYYCASDDGSSKTSLAHKILKKSARMEITFFGGCFSFIILDSAGSKAKIILLGPFWQSGIDVEEWNTMFETISCDRSIHCISLLPICPEPKQPFTPMRKLEQFEAGKWIAREIIRILE